MLIKQHVAVFGVGVSKGISNVSAKRQQHPSDMIPSLYSWNIAECDVKPQPTNQPSDMIDNLFCSYFEYKKIQPITSTITFCMDIPVRQQFLQIRSDWVEIFADGP